MTLKNVDSKAKLSKFKNEQNSVPCPVCGEQLHRVVDSRPGEFNGTRVVVRRRPCGTCQKNQPTVEVPVEVLRQWQRETDNSLELLKSLMSRVTL